MSASRPGRRALRPGRSRNSARSIFSSPMRRSGPTRRFETTAEDWRRVMGTNLESRFMVPGVPARHGGRWGRVVLVTGRNDACLPGMSLPRSPHGPFGLTKTLRASLGQGDGHAIRRARSIRAAIVRDGGADGDRGGRSGRADRHVERSRRCAAVKWTAGVREWADDREWRIDARGCHTVASPAG